MARHSGQTTQTRPNTAEHVRNISSTTETPESERALNSRDEGSAQVRQTFQSIKNRIREAFARKGK